MYRFTTPTVTFRIKNPDIDLEDMAQIWVTIEDSRGFVHNWDKTRVSVDNTEKKVRLYLSQRETMKLCEGDGKAQIRFLTNDGVPFGTKETPITIKNWIKGGIIS